MARKPKKIPYRLIPNDGTTKPMYRMMSDLIHEHHSHLRDAKIALAWHAGWKADVDGRVVLGRCKRASDLDRQLSEFDFVIILNREFWTAPEVTIEQKQALLDHELCHAEVVIDPTSDEPHEDESGRTVYRIRRHDIEEFSEIVERHGCYKKDLEQFAAALLRGPQGELFAKELKKGKPSIKAPAGESATVN